MILPGALFFLLMLFETNIVGLLMSYYPPMPGQGERYYRDYVHLARTEILWYGFFVLSTALLLTYSSSTALRGLFSLQSQRKAVFYMMLVASGFFFLTILTNHHVLEGFANSSDEYAYIFQAEMFSRGKLWERAHDLPDFFYNNNIAQHDGILVSRFPPGWPLLLSGAFEIGLNPALMNPVLGVAALILFYFFVKRYYSTPVAIWSMLGVALTGFYIFNSASYFSHVSCFLVTLLFVFNIYLFKEKDKFGYAILAGFFLGCVVVIRYYTALLVFIPFIVYLTTQYRWKVVRLFFWMGVGSLPCIAYLLWYNYSITGNALVPVTMWAYPSEQLGFVKGHTVLKGFEHVLRRTLMFVYWTSPGLLLLYLFYIIRKVRSSAERLVRPEDYAFLMLGLGYFFYYQIGGNQYGPRFLFEAFPFLVVFVVSRVLESREKWAIALLFVSLIYPIVKAPFIAEREAAIIDQRQDVYDLVREQKIQNAVVFVSSATSPLRPMPASDLTRNDPMFINDVIYVLEIARINKQLMDYYPDREVYRYVRGLDETQGELIKIR